MSLMVDQILLSPTLAPGCEILICHQFHISSEEAQSETKNNTQNSITKIYLSLPKTQIFLVEFNCT